MSTETPAKAAAAEKKPVAVVAEAISGKTPEPSPVEEAKEVLETIVPNKEAKTWTFGKGTDVVTYVQRPLSYFGKMEWFALLAEAIDRVMQDGTTVTDMLSQVGVVGDRSSISVSDFTDADTFIRSMAKLAQAMPEFFEESYCMWLNVARGDREYVKAIMKQPEDDGGLNDEQGFEIMERFLDQNVGAIESFFVERLPKLGKRASALMTRKVTGKK